MISLIKLEKELCVIEEEAKEYGLIYHPIERLGVQKGLVTSMECWEKYEDELEEDELEESSLLSPFSRYSGAETFVKIKEDNHLVVLEKFALIFPYPFTVLCTITEEV